MYLPGQKSGVSHWLNGTHLDWDDQASMLDYSPSRQEHDIDNWTGLHASPFEKSSLHQVYNSEAKVPPSIEKVTNRGGMYTYSPERPLSRAGSVSGRSPLKACHDLGMTFRDSDSGFSSSLLTRSRGYGQTSLADNLLSPPSPGRLMRSRSLSRLGDGNPEDQVLFTHQSLDTNYRRPELYGSDRVIKELKNKLEESENRRTVLMSKLKEAQKTLQAQGDRLDRIEITAKENEYVVESLKVKEQEYRQKIGNFEREQDEKDFLKLENLRLREDMQTRISALAQQLQTLQSQYSASQNEGQKRNSLLEQTSKALNLLEEENTKFQKERDNAVTEMNAAKDSFQITKAKFALMEEENSLLKSDFNKLSEEYDVCERKMAEFKDKVQDLETLVQTLRNENERLAAAWETTTEEKQKLAQEQDRFEETLKELKCQVTMVMSEKDKSMQEKMELQKQHQQLVVDKEQLMKSKISLEEFVNELQNEMTQTRMISNKTEEEKRRLEEELKAVKKVSEDLSSELSSAKSAYERTIEQVTILENRKTIAGQQYQVLEQENRRLEMELQKTKDNLVSKEADMKAERNQLEENIHKYKDEMRGMRIIKGQSEDKCRELDTKLKRANEELQQNVSVQQSELDSWKTTCERLTGSVSRKEAEIQSMTDKCGDMEDLVSKLKKEVKVYEDQLEQCLEAEDMSDRLREDNRRLLQEKAENEQMLQLLEMQKEVLSKSSESNLDRLHEVDQLMGRMDQLRNDNTLLRDRIVELERLRDSLMKQKSDLCQQSVENHYLKTSQEQSNHLQHVNQVLTKKLEKLEQENAALKLRCHTSTEMVPKEEMNRLQQQKKLVEEEYNCLKQQHQDLTERHQRFVISYGHNSNNSNHSDHQGVLKDKAIVEKQVTYLQGQIILLESSKKRAEETIKEFEAKVDKLEDDLKQNDRSQDLEDLENSLKESSKKRESLEALVRALKQQLVQGKKQVSQDEIDGDLSQLKDELQKLTGVLNGKDEQIEQLDNQVGDLKKQLKKERQRRVLANPKKEEDQPQAKPTILSKPLSSSAFSNGEKSLSRGGTSMKTDGNSNSKGDNCKSRRGDFITKGDNPLASGDNYWKQQDHHHTSNSDSATEPRNSLTESQQLNTSIFKPPTRQVHPRLQLLMERYTENGDEVTDTTNDDLTSDDKTNNSGKRWPYNKLTSSQSSLVQRRLSPITVKNTQNDTTLEMGIKKVTHSGAASNEEILTDDKHKNSLLDSQEQRDISGLIQKYIKVLEM